MDEQWSQLVCNFLIKGICRRIWPIRIFHVELTQSEVEYEYDMFALRYKPAGFSATPGGLSINSATGIIDVSASVSGTYEDYRLMDRTHKW